MNRILTFFLSFLLVSTICAQNTDTLTTVIPDETIAGDSVMLSDYVSAAVYRSWRKAHPLRPSDPTAYDLTGSALSRTDSLLSSLDQPAGQSREMLYLYDMRLPLINSGSVPADTTTAFYQTVDEEEQQHFGLDLPISHYDRVYEQQRQNEAQRHMARFRYASVDPRRFRYARRHFDVPTADIKAIDTKATVQNVRVADDIDFDFANVDVDLFGPSVVFRADKWHWKGDHSLTMQQTALSDNWYKGGDNNMSVASQQKLTISRYDEEKKTTFETVLDLKLSGYYTKADTVHRMKVSDNEFSLNMKYGYRAWKKWYYSAQLYAKTPVFDYYNSNSSTCLSTFLSPLELNLSFGVDYQYTSPGKKFTYSLLLAPLSYDLKSVSDARVDVTKYGIEEGNNTLHKFGSTITSKMEWKMSDNASWSSRLYYFTAYNSIQVEFENTFNFRISRYFTTKIYAYPRFDDTRDVKMELKEMLTLGFNYQW